MRDTTFYILLILVGFANLLSVIELFRYFAR